MTTMYLLLCVCFALAALGESRPFGVSPIALSRRQNGEFNQYLTCRGGGTSTVVEDEYDLDVDDSEVEESESEEEEEEEEEAGSSLLSSTMKATTKTQTKKTATAKKAVNTAMAETKKPVTKTKSSLIRIPYILRACLNPFTVLSMTKAYFASLFNLDYAKKEPSQDLRSALEEKAKKATGGGARGRRKMKPGQAKTISDLPALNT